MSSFTDSQGRKWSINMTIGLASRIKKETKFDFVGALYDPKKAYRLLGELYQDLEIFCDVIVIACSIKDDDRQPFLEGLDGEDLANAFEALDQSFTDFYPPAKRAQIAQWKESLKKALETEQDVIMEELNHKMATELPGLMKGLLLSQNSTSGS